MAPIPSGRPSPAPSASSLTGRRLAALLALVSALALLAAACTEDTTTGAASGGADGCDPAIDRALAGWEDAGFSGTVAFVDPDRPCIAGYGRRDPGAAGGQATSMAADTVFSIGSITKAVTAAAVAGLEHDGRLSYDDRAGDLVPGLAGPVAEATVGQLLVHTSGVAGSHGPDHVALTRPDAIAALSALGAETEPGETFAYANAGYATLALIVDEVTGGYRDHLVGEILVDGDGASIGGFWDGEPAAPGPRAVGVTDGGEPGEDGSFAGPHWALDGSGGVAMTAEELARWTADLFAGRIIEPEAVEDMLALRFDHGDGTAEVPGWVEVDEVAFGEPMLGTSGGGGGIGHDMTVVWLPDSGRVYVVATNTGEVRAEQLLTSLLPDLVEGLAPAGPPVAGELDPQLVEAVAGRWELPGGARFDVTAEGPGLRVRALDPDAVAAVLPVGDPEAAADHERRVIDVIGGSTEEGVRERELFEASFGPIGEVRVFGTAYLDGEHRTWLEVEPVDGDPILLWLALQPNDAIAAAEVRAEPPSVGYLPRPDGTLAPLDQPGGGGGPSLAWQEGELRVDGAVGALTATPSER